MKSVSTQAIVLNRTDFGEADRIITFLTPDQGKVAGLAKGVRKTKSKLAGGIELFSISDISYIPGRGEVSTVISTRLIAHFGNIVKDIERTNTGYDFIKLVNKLTEDHPDSTYFKLLATGFESLDNFDINLELIDLWFRAQLLKLAGHGPNLITDEAGKRLNPNAKYVFNYEAMNFNTSDTGDSLYDVNAIKFLRLVFGDNLPKTIQKVAGCEQLSKICYPLTSSMLQVYVRV